MQTSRQNGQSIIEFAFMLVLGALVVLVGLSLFGVSVTDAFQAIVSALPFT